MSLRRAWVCSAVRKTLLCLTRWFPSPTRRDASLAKGIRPSNITVKSILDTDILSEYFKGHNASVANRAATYAKDHGLFTFTSVTVYEIVYGLELKGASSQLKTMG